MAQLHPGEPTFVIRAQDMLAPLAVEAWSNFAELAARATGVQHLHQQAEEARHIAGEMRRWQETNPHLTRWPD